MTIYTSPELFEDQTPSAGARLGTAFGSGMSDIMNRLAEKKLKTIEAYNKGYGELPSAIAKYAKDTGRSELYSTKDYEKINKLGNKFLKAGYSPMVAAREATNMYDPPVDEGGDESPSQLAKLLTGALFGALGSAVSGIERKEYDPEDDPRKKYNVGVADSPIGVLLKHMKAPEEKDIRDYPESKFYHEKMVPWAKKQLEFEDKEGSQALRERAKEKSFTAKSVDDFTRGELANLDVKDIQNLPKDIQKDVRWASSMEGAKAVSGYALNILPIAGKRLSKEILDSIDPNMPKPAGITDLARIGLEYRLLGKLMGPATGLASKGIIAARGGRALGAAGKRAASSIGDAAVFGGEGALSEYARTLFTDKPADLKQAGIQGLLGSIFPYVGWALKGISKPFRKSAAKTMQREGVSSLKAAELLLEKAEEKGISMQNLQKGLEPERVKFVEFLSDESAISTAKKLEKLPLRRAETAQEASKRFSEEAKTISKTPIEEYLLPKEKSPSFLIREKESKLSLLNAEKNIVQSKKALKNAVGEQQVKEARKALSDAERKKYEIEHWVREGRIPKTSEEMAAAAEKSALKLRESILNPTEKTEAAIRKNDTIMNTYLRREREEIVKGNFPTEFRRDFLIGINESHQKSYKNMLKKIREEMKNPRSPLSLSGKGKELEAELVKRIRGQDAAINVQTQKRKVLSALESPRGIFYRNWVDKLRDQKKIYSESEKKVLSHLKGGQKEIYKSLVNNLIKRQKLYSNDMIRLTNQISQAEKSVTPIALKRMEQSGEKIAMSKTTKAAEAKAKSSLKKGGGELASEAEKAGYSAKESESVENAIGWVKKTPKSAGWEDLSKRFRAASDIFLKPVKNQMMAGIAMGLVDSVSRELFGVGIPGKTKTIIYGSLGLSHLSGGKKLPLAASAYATHDFISTMRKNYYRKELASLRGARKRREYERLKKKKGFTSSELKYIRS